MLAIMIFAVPAIGIAQKIFEGYHKYQLIIKNLGEEQTNWILKQGVRK